MEVKRGRQNPEVDLVFGVRNDELVHISQADSGLACGCHCPGCGEKLVAKKGQVQRHHFAHSSGANCLVGIESALHIAAKDILAVKKEIVLPAVIVRFSGGKGAVEIEPKRPYEVSDVRLEKRLDGIIPDVLANVEGQDLAIEIFVTHRVDERKDERFRKLGLSAIEIDLSGVSRDLDTKNLESLVVDGVSHKRWIFNVAEDREKATALRRATRIKTISRRFARHADGCPIPAREYYGKPYANVIDDCLSCEHCVDTEENLNVILCDGHLGISQKSRDRRTLLWVGHAESVDLCRDASLTRGFELRSVSRSLDGMLYIEGFSRKEREKKTLRLDEVDGLIDLRTGEFRDAMAWLDALTGGRVRK
jgi:hypothetical protein